MTTSFSLLVPENKSLSCRAQCRRGGLLAIFLRVATPPPSLTPSPSQTGKLKGALGRCCRPVEGRKVLCPAAAAAEATAAQVAHQLDPEEPGQRRHRHRPGGRAVGHRQVLVVTGRSVCLGAFGSSVLFHACTIRREREREG